MPSGLSSITATRKRELWIAATVVVATVVLRSLVFVFWEQSYFDSDQAIVGLMAKHLIEGRAFPLFFYGQTYMLAVDAYLAAPVFAVGGVSVATLKLPLLALNVIVAILLLIALVREAGLRPYHALVAVLFFALPSPAVTAEILAANGGNFAPFVYSILIWMTRAHPGWSGFFLGLGFLHREFTIYAAVALVAVDALSGALWNRERLGRYVVMCLAAVAVFAAVQILRPYSSPAGPGTTTADLFQPRNNIFMLAERWCGEVARLPGGFGQLFTVHWPVIFGMRPMPLVDLGIESRGAQGLHASWPVLAIAVMIPLAAIGRRLARERRWRPEYDLCAYLVLMGISSAIGYVVGRCGQLSNITLRYDMLSIFAAVGLGAWFLAIAEPPALRSAWIAVAIATVGISGYSHALLLTEYITHPPGNPKRLIVRHLEARGVKYASAGYWRAYAITFLTNERIIVASEDYQRVLEHTRIVDAHRNEAVRLSPESCAGGRLIMYRLWMCPM